MAVFTAALALCFCIHSGYRSGTVSILLNSDPMLVTVFITTRIFIDCMLWRCCGFVQGDLFSQTTFSLSPSGPLLSPDQLAGPHKVINHTSSECSKPCWLEQAWMAVWIDTSLLKVYVKMSEHDIEHVKRWHLFYCLDVCRWLSNNQTWTKFISYRIHSNSWTFADLLQCCQEESSWMMFSTAGRCLVDYTSIWTSD